MRIGKIKGFASFTAILLVLAVASWITLPAVNAHTPAWTITTHAYVAVSPNTVGVGQYTLIVMWLDWVPPTAGGLGGDRWYNFTLTITKPDGTKETRGPFTSSQVGSAWATYTPEQAGDYTIVFSFPGQVATNGTGTPNFRGLAYVGDYFTPSTSAPVTLHVTQEHVKEWEEPPLPTEFWTRPINDANREWSQLASNWLLGSWLRTSNFQEWGRAPDSPHILWSKLIDFGGIADTQWWGIPYDTNDYQSPWSSPIIMNGRIYYNEPQDASTPRYGYHCLDLYTGEEIWYKNGTDNGLNNPVTMVGYASGANTAPELHQSFPTLSFGQIYQYYSVNGHGTVAYLWMTVGSTWYMLSAWDGNWIMTLKNVPGGTTVTDQDGSILRYSYSSTTGRILCWNSSQAIPPSGPTGTGQQIWKPRVGAVIDAVNDTSWTTFGPRAGQWDASDILPRSGYTMNVTVQTGLPSISRVVQDANRVPRIIFGFSISPPIATSALSEPTQTFEAYAIRIDEHVAPYSPFPDKSNTQNNNLGFGATLLWHRNYTNPSTTPVSLSLGSVDYDNRLFLVKSKETMQMWAYSLDTGDLLWGPTQPEEAWNMYGISDTIAYGKIYTVGYSGILHAYDVKTGKLLWNYTAPGIGHESPYGNYPLSIGAIADGKVYLYSTEHSPTKPLWRGSYLRCVDAETGKELWKLMDFNMGMGVADGYIVTGSQYDNMVYCIGKGPSAVMVTASPKVVAKGGSVLIEGTVTDQSPGAKKLVQSGRFSMVPAVADEYMEEWMEYLYMQQAIPGDAKGVPVKLQAVGSDGSVVDIGTVTSDMAGTYSYLWTPPTTGVYKIIATFEGSKSYYASYAETSVGVTAAPSASISPPASAPTSPSASAASPSVAPPSGGGAGIDMFMVAAAVVVIAVIVAAALVLKRRSK